MPELGTLFMMMMTIIMMMTTMMMMMMMIIIIIITKEICAMWKQNVVQEFPRVILSTEVIPKSLSQNLKRLDLHSNTYTQMQKSVVFQVYSCKFSA